VTGGRTVCNSHFNSSI